MLNLYSPTQKFWGVDLVWVKDVIGL